MVLLTNFPPPSDGIQHQQVNTSVDIDGTNYGNGTLFIAQSCVVWQKEGDGKGFSLHYPAICCHAISRDLNAFPQECLYVMLDGKLPQGDSDDDDDDDDDDDEDDEGSLTEIRFIPADKNMLEPMFAAMSDCNTLHPDPDDEDYDDEAYVGEDEGGDWTENGFHGTAEDSSQAAGDSAHHALSNFADVLHLGQGDGPGTSGAMAPPAVMSASGDAWQDENGEEEEEELEMDVGQFHDAEDMQ